MDGSNPCPTLGWGAVVFAHLVPGRVSAVIGSRSRVTFWVLCVYWSISSCVFPSTVYRVYQPNSWLARPPPLPNLQLFKQCWWVVYSTHSSLLWYTKTTEHSYSVRGIRMPLVLWFVIRPPLHSDSQAKLYFTAAADWCNSWTWSGDSTRQQALVQRT